MNNLVVYDKNKASLIGDESNCFSHGFEITIDESKLANNTTEYLNNTYGKVESPEHAEFIIELCEVNGIGRDSWIDGVIYFYITNNELYFTDRASVPDDGLKQITIPMPPKKQDWPQVGDEVVTTGGSNGILVISEEDKDGMVVANFDGEYALCYKRELSKPKSEDEILRDKIGSILDSYVMSDKVKSHFIDEIINITKKPQ